jgi:hypothetical protein
MKVCATRLTHRLSSGQRRSEKRLTAIDLVKPRARKYGSIYAIATVIFDRWVKPMKVGKLMIGLLDSKGCAVPCADPPSSVGLGANDQKPTPKGALS